MQTTKEADMSLELIGGLIRTDAEEPPVELLRAVAGATRIICLPNRVIGLCPMPNGKTLYASTPLGPIRRQLAPRFVATMQNRPGWGWGSITGSFKAVVKIKGIGKVTRLISKAAIKVKPFVGQLMGKVPVYGKIMQADFKRYGYKGMMGGGIGRAIMEGAKLKSAIKGGKIGAYVSGIIDGAAKGNPKSEAIIRKVHELAPKDPRAARALAQMRIVNKVRMGEAAKSVLRIHAIAAEAKQRAAQRMPPEKAARVSAKLDAATRKATGLRVPRAVAMPELEPDAKRRAWIIRACAQEVAACPEGGAAVAGFWRTGPMTEPTGTGIFAWLRRRYMAGVAR